MRLCVVPGLLASLVLAACNLGGIKGQVDGWSIAEQLPCAATDARCQRMIEVATERLNERDPAHPPVAQVSVHAEGMYPNDDGSMGSVIRSGGPPTIIVFVLTDGTSRAIGVKYVLNDDLPTAFDRGPERRGGVGGNNAPAPTT
jgi:hypothetical protein